MQATLFANGRVHNLNLHFQRLQAARICPVAAGLRRAGADGFPICRDCSSGSEHVLGGQPRRQRRLPSNLWNYGYGA